MSNSLYVESSDSTSTDSFDSTNFQDVDWSEEQLAFPTLARVIKLVTLRFCPERSDLRTETPKLLKYIRKWKKLSLTGGIFGQKYSLK